MSESMPAAAAEEETSVRTRYLVTWQQKGRDRVRRAFCIVDDADMTRPGDVEQRDQVIRQQLSMSLPYEQMQPENVILESVEVLCNCEPLPTTKNCVYREHKGLRFYMTTSEAYAGCGVIHDRHGDTIVGIVSVTESVEFLTLVREKYGHR